MESTKENNKDGAGEQVVSSTTNDDDTVKEIPPAPPRPYVSLFSDPNEVAAVAFANAFAMATTPEMLRDRGQRSPGGPYDVEPTCMVCGAKSTGCNNGVSSCNACKAFFRRTILKRKVYICRNHSRCLVNVHTRNFCQACRFNKCIAFGMTCTVDTDDGARYSGVPLGGQAMDHPLPPNIYGGEVSLSPNIYGGKAIIESEIKLNLWNELAVCITTAVEAFVQYVSNVRGFRGLPQDDQLILIKAGFFENFLGGSRRGAPNEMVTPHGDIITQDTMEKIYGRKLARETMKFVSLMSSANLNENEARGMAELLLTSPHRAGLADVAAVEAMHRTATMALYNGASPHNLSSEFAQTRFYAINGYADMARALGDAHLQAINWCRENWYKLNAPQLFIETFDIPKTYQDAFEVQAASQPPTVSYFFNSYQ